MPNISFNGGYKLRPKVSGSEAAAFPLHPGSQYYGKFSQHAYLISVWIPLVDVGEVNGCLYVVPGSNHWEFIGSARDVNRNMYSFEDVEARGTPVTVPMKRGNILPFHNGIFHGSKINRSDGVRWSIDIKYCRMRGTYIASSSEQEGEDFMCNKGHHMGSFHLLYEGKDHGVRLSNGIHRKTALNKV